MTDPNNQGEIPGVDANPEQEPLSPVQAEAPVGAQLRAVREQLGLSVGDVAQRLKFAPRQIEALESDNQAALPSLTFVRGFVRSYAKLLGLDADALVASLERSVARDADSAGPSTVQLQSLTATPQRFPTRSPTSSGWPWMLAMLFAVLGLGGFALYQWQAPDALTKAPANAPVAVPLPIPAPAAAPATDPAPAPGMPAAPATPSAAPAAPGSAAAPAAGPAAPAPAGAATVPISPAARPDAKAEANPDASKGDAGGKGKIRLVFTQESWTEVKQAKGQVVFSRQSSPGSEAWVDGQPPFDFVIGNAEGVKLFYRGNPVDLKPYIRDSVARLQLK